MGFRNLIITQEARLTTQNGYLVVTMPEQVHKIHLSELDSIVLENPRVKISGVLLNKLTQNNIAVILCDEKHHPYSMMLPIYGNFHRVKNINRQIKWDQETKGLVWQKIIREKIRLQGQVLRGVNQDDKLLMRYFHEIEPDDVTNREGLAAKAYFRALFGEKFIRQAEDPTNWALNYGYAILAGYFTRTVVAKGYLTEIGIKHKNEFNGHNFAYDLMEPFRPLVDLRVKLLIRDEFGQKERHQLLDLVNEQVVFNGSKQYLPNAIDLYVQAIVKQLNDPSEKGTISVQWERGTKG